MLVMPLGAQDTLRTYGPRIGIDLTGFVFLFADPPVAGSEASLDFELYENLFPVAELGFSTLSETVDLAEYRSTGPYVRIGLDYNLLPVTDRSIHHSITTGFRYGISLFTHHADQITITSGYWGDLLIESYENSPDAHWMELVGGIKAEVLPNFFLGWTVRYRILFNPDMDPQVAPLHIPGYGNGTENRGFGFTYTVSYKIPVLKR